MGFEPTRPLARPNGFQGRRIQPLCHPSGVARADARGPVVRSGLLVLIGLRDAPVALPRLGDDLLRRRLLRGHRAAAARLRRRSRPEQGAGGDPLGLLRGGDAAGRAAGRLRRQPDRPAADRDRRACCCSGSPASLFGLVHADRPARRGPLHPGHRRRADLGRGADLADHLLSGGEPRQGDRHRARHRGRRRSARPGARARWPRRSAPSVVFGSVLVISLGARLRGLAAARGAEPRSARAAARGRRARCSSRPILDGADLRRRALGDVRRDRGAGAAADRRASAAATR